MKPYPNLLRDDETDFRKKLCLQKDDWNHWRASDRLWNAFLGVLSLDWLIPLPRRIFLKQENISHFWQHEDPVDLFQTFCFELSFDLLGSNEEFFKSCVFEEIVDGSQICRVFCFMDTRWNPVRCTWKQKDQELFKISSFTQFTSDWMLTPCCWRSRVCWNSPGPPVVYCQQGGSRGGCYTVWPYLLFTAASAHEIWWVLHRYSSSPRTSAVIAPSICQIILIFGRFRQSIRLKCRIWNVLAL